MCTVVALIRPGHDWPVVIAANRDEMRTRPSQPPSRHWEDRTHVTAGLDVQAGGTWLGLNDDGLIACVLNRINSLGPMDGKRSRGELPLEALDHADARAATEALVGLNPAAYRSFNMVIADRLEAWWIAGNDHTREISATRLDPGVSMITAFDMNDQNSDRIRHHLPRFRRAPAPDPTNHDWFAWEALMADRGKASDADWSGAMNVQSEDGEYCDFATVSSSLIALPAIVDEGDQPQPVWRYADGRPDRAPYRDVLL